MLNHVLSNHLLKKDIEMSHWSIYKPEKVPKKIKGLMTVFSMLINKMVKQQRKFFLELFKFSGGFFLQENQKSSHSLCPLPSSWSNKRFYLNWLSHLCGLRLILIEYGFTENAIEKSREDYFQMPKRRLCSFYQYKAKKKFWELVTLLGISSHKYAVVLYLLNFCWAVLLHWIWKHCSAIPNQIVFFDMQLV